MNLASQLGQTANDATLDATVVRSSGNLEGSLVSPALVPAVDAQPVLGSVLNAPADDLKDD